MESKICKKCGELKFLAEFNKRASSKDGYRYECKNCQKETSEIYYKQNKEKILERSKHYYDNNVENYKKKHSEYYHDNKETYSQRVKKYQQDKKEIYKERSKLWASKNTNKINDAKVRFKTKNPNYHTNYISNRKKNDPLFKLTVNLRRRVILFLNEKNIHKNNKTFEIVGCTPMELKEYLENKFIDGMTWSNQGEWHVDHIIPLSSAKTHEDAFRLCHFTNLQPLWAKDNLKKGSKIYYEIK
jgi:hypothetical protein